MEQHEEKLVYTPKDIMAILGLGKSIIYTALKLGIIPHFKIGKLYIIPKARFQRWLDEELPNIPTLQS